MTSTIPAATKAPFRRIMSGNRFQHGSVHKVKNKKLPDAWYFRYYDTVNGKGVHRNQRLGTITDLPTRKSAEQAAHVWRERINAGTRIPETVAQLVEHYKLNELTLERKANSTVEGHTSYLDNHITPKWGKMSLSEIRTVAVESWLDAMEKAPGTRAKIRNIMSALFSHAIRHEWITKNPISHVRTSAQRMREPDILGPEEFQALIKELDGPERLMVFLAGSTGMRRGELIALRWSDVDFLNNEVQVIRSCVRNVIGKVKTEASKKPLPLHNPAIRELSAWRAKTLYKEDADFVFASPTMEGKQPLSPDTLLKKRVRPALEQAKIVGKVVGWHTFRHSLGTTLRSLGVDVKIASELLRHANIRITLDLYTQAISSEKRAASALALDRMLGDNPVAMQ